MPEDRLMGDWARRAATAEQLLNGVGYFTWLILGCLALRVGLFTDDIPMHARVVGLLATALAIGLGVFHKVRRASEERLSWRWPSLVLQTIATLLAVAALDSTMAALLIILVGLVVEAGTRHQTWTWFGVANTVLLVVMLVKGPFSIVSIIWALFVGFQLFAFGMYVSLENQREWRERLAGVNAELLATRRLLQESSRSQERLRISRELHDLAGHRLTALKLNLRSMAGREEHDPERIRLCHELSGELLEDIRAAVHQLRSDDEIDLLAALGLLQRQHPDLSVDLRVADEVRVRGIGVAEAIVRSTQEAITNAVKHGRAKRVWVEVVIHADDVVLTIRDDGSGGPRSPGGQGLRGMLERAEGLGGTVSIEPQLESGWQLRAFFPKESS